MGSTRATARPSSRCPSRSARCSRRSAAAAPVVWVLLVRTCALLAVWLAWRSAGGWPAASPLAGAAAALGVLLCGRLLGLSAAGAEPALVLAAALGGRGGVGRGAPARGAGLRARLRRCCAWRHGRSCSCSAPSCGAGGPSSGRRRGGGRRWCPRPGSCRSGSGRATCCARARARASRTPASRRSRHVPALASLREAVKLPCGRSGSASPRSSRRRVRPGAPRTARPALARGRRCPGAALAVASWRAMAQPGFSGEPRYALPGAALLAVAGAAGLGARRRSGPVARGWSPSAPRCCSPSPSPCASPTCRRSAPRRPTSGGSARARRRGARGRRPRGGAALRHAVRRAAARAAHGLSAARAQGSRGARRAAAPARRGLPLRARGGDRPSPAPRPSRRAGRRSLARRAAARGDRGSLPTMP